MSFSVGISNLLSFVLAPAPKEVNIHIRDISPSKKPEIGAAPTLEFAP